MQAYGIGAMPSFVLCERGINSKTMCVDECLWPIARCIAGLFEQELWVGLVEIPSHWADLQLCNQIANTMMDVRCRSLASRSIRKLNLIWIANSDGTA